MYVLSIEIYPSEDTSAKMPVAFPRHAKSRYIKLKIRYKLLVLHNTIKIPTQRT